MRTILAILFALLLAGCAGDTRLLTFWNGDTVTFPNGAVFGGASSEQVGTLAEIFVDAHNASMSGMQEMREEHRRTAEQSLSMLENLSKRQGSGEITIFFETGATAIPPGTLEHDRLVRFLDYLSRESNGRKVLLVSIGSASRFGDSRHNARLADRRAQAPVPVIERYLVNVPHEFHRVYSVGDQYSPGNIPMSEHLKYQHTRIVAVFETNQLRGRLRDY